MSQMKAVTRQAYGGPEVLEFTTAAVPEPGEGELLVRVRAGSPNAADWHLLTGEPLLVRPQSGLRRPKHQYFGTDVAGVVEAVGPGVGATFTVGDRVFGSTGGRGFAELAPMSAGHTTTIPDGVSFAEAAALSIAGVTALQAVRDKGDVTTGDRVLVNGASGGVGHFAVQVAVLLGAEVTAVSSARNHQLLRELGAHETIDYATTDYTATGRTWDVLVDVQGNHPARANRRVLAEEGRWVIVGGPKRNRLLGPMGYVAAAMLRFAFASQSATFFVAEETTERLATLARWVADGELTPSIERTYALPEVADAMRHIGEGHTRGKLVIEVTT